MIETFDRTRFLDELDRMLMQDRQGAIDDMLQVLRECGAIKQAYAAKMMDNHRLELDGYRDHCKTDAAVSMGYLLLNDGIIQFAETEDERSPYLTNLIGKAFFVTKP